MVSLTEAICSLYITDLDMSIFVLLDSWPADVIGLDPEAEVARFPGRVAS